MATDGSILNYGRHRRRLWRVVVASVIIGLTLLGLHFYGPMLRAKARTAYDDWTYRRAYAAAVKELASAENAADGVALGPTAIRHASDLLTRTGNTADTLAGVTPLFAFEANAGLAKNLAIGMLERDELYLLVFDGNRRLMRSRFRLGSVVIDSDITPGVVSKVVASSRVGQIATVVFDLHGKRQTLRIDLGDPVVSAKTVFNPPTLAQTPWTLEAVDGWVFGDQWLPEPATVRLITSIAKPAELQMSSASNSFAFGERGLLRTTSSGLFQYDLTTHSEIQLSPDSGGTLSPDGKVMIRSVPVKRTIACEVATGNTLHDFGSERLIDPHFTYDHRVTTATKNYVVHLDPMRSTASYFPEFRGAAQVAFGGKIAAVIGGRTGMVQLYDRNTKDRILTPAPPRNEPAAIALSPDGRWLAMYNAAFCIDDLKSPERPLLIPWRFHVRDRFVWSADGSRMAFCDEAGFLYLWSAERPGTLIRIKHNAGSLPTLAIDQAGQRLVIGGADRTLFWSDLNALLRESLPN